MTETTEAPVAAPEEKTPTPTTENEEEKPAETTNGASEKSAEEEKKEEKKEDPPKEMRAVVLTGFGGFKNVKILKKPEPTVATGEVLIRVKAW